jgi:hypothetical protein
VKRDVDCCEESKKNLGESPPKSIVSAESATESSNDVAS